MTRNELVAVTTRRLQAGKTPTAANVSRDDVDMLVLQAMSRLCSVAAQSPSLRHLLVSKVTPALTATGEVDLTVSPCLDLHRGSLQYASVYDPDDTDELQPYVFRDNWQDLDGYLDQAYGYYAVRGSSIVFRRRQTVEEAVTSLTGNMRIYGLLIPFKGAAVLPDSGELFDLAGDLLAEEYLKLFTPPEAENR